MFRKWTGSKNKTKVISPDPFEQMPDEAMLFIFSYLDIINLTMLCRVSKKFNNLARDKYLWKRFATRLLAKGEEPPTKQFKFFYTHKYHEKLPAEIIKEELRFVHLSEGMMYQIDQTWNFPIPLLLSYTIALDDKLLHLKEIKRKDKSVIVNRHLAELTNTYNYNFPILDAIQKFMSIVCPNSEGPLNYVQYEDLSIEPELYLYLILKKFAEEYTNDIIIFKTPKFLQTITNYCVNFPSKKTLVLRNLGLVLLANPKIITNPNLTLCLDSILIYFEKDNVRKEKMVKHVEAKIGLKTSTWQSFIMRR